MTCNEKSVCLVKTIQIAKFGFSDPPPKAQVSYIAECRERYRWLRLEILSNIGVKDFAICQSETQWKQFSASLRLWSCVTFFLVVSADDMQWEKCLSRRDLSTCKFSSQSASWPPPLGTGNFVKRVLTKSHNITMYYLAYCDWSVGIDWYWSPCCDWPRGRQRHFWLYKRRHWAFFFRVFLLSPVTLSFDSAASRLYVWNLWFLRLFSFWCMPTCLLRWNWVCWLNMLGLRFTSNIRGSLVQCPYSRLAILLRRAISERLRWISLVCL